MKPFVKRIASECAKGFRPSILGAALIKQALTMTCGRFVAGLYGKHSQRLTFAPLRVEAELSCVHSLAQPYILQI